MTRPAGAIRRHTVSGAPELVYYTHRPSDFAPDGPVLVSVHGISRNARAHARALSRLSEARQVMVMAPLFDARRFPDYQRLGVRGLRADRALERMLADLRQRTGADVSRFRLFGYSGGGQFAHRYALVNPGRILALGVGAAGWYTFPDDHRPFPHGSRDARWPEGTRVDLDRFLRLPIRVFVGDGDNERDPSLRASPDIDECQGATRGERASRWAAALRWSALERGLVADVELHVLAGAAHCFEQNVRDARLVASLESALF